MLVVVFWRGPLRAPSVVLEVPEDFADHRRVGQEREDPHLLTAVARERIGFVDAADELSPLPSKPPSLR